MFLLCKASCITSIISSFFLVSSAMFSISMATFCKAIHSTHTLNSFYYLWFAWFNFTECLLLIVLFKLLFEFADSFSLDYKKHYIDLWHDSCFLTSRLLKLSPSFDSCLILNNLAFTIGWLELLILTRYRYQSLAEYFLPSHRCYLSHTRSEVPDQTQAKNLFHNTGS